MNAGRAEESRDISFSIMHNQSKSIIFIKYFQVIKSKKSFEFLKSSGRQEHLNSWKSFFDNFHKKLRTLNASICLQ
jgi:hypothetical protein